MFLVIPFGRKLITPRAPPVPRGPRASSVQVASFMEGACACAFPMTRNADPTLRQVYISLVAIIVFDASSQVSVSCTVLLLQQ